jgi:hypothetical protein
MSEVRLAPLSVDRLPYPPPWFDVRTLRVLLTMRAEKALQMLREPSW